MITSCTTAVTVKISVCEPQLLGTNLTCLALEGANTNEYVCFDAATRFIESEGRDQSHSTS